MKNALHTRFLLLLFFGSLCLPFTKARAQNWMMRNGYGSTTGTDRISGMAVDAAGNVYTTGSFTGIVDFGTGPITAVGNLDGFVTKFSSTGVCQWAIRFNGPGTAQDQGLGIATNGTSVFVGGIYQTSLSINGAAAITGYGGIDGFGFKLDAATGATQWATVFGSGSTDAVQAMCIDNAGNMYVTGYFSSNATYPTATFGSFTRSSNGGTGTDAYVARLDGTTGGIVWVSSGGMSGYNDNVSNSGLAYAPAQNAVVMVGSLQAPSSGTTVNYTTTSPASAVTLTSQGGLDICVLELDASNGTFQNAASVGGAASSNEEALSAAYDPASQKVVMTGYFNTSALTFGSNPTINPIGSDDIWYAAYDPAANSFSWSKAAGSTIQDRGQSITANGIGGVFITGRYRNTMTAPTASSSISAVSSRTSSADEIYLLHVSSQTGNAIRLLTPVGDATINTGDIGTGLAASNTGAVWLGGMFGGTVSFSPLSSLTTSGGTTADILIAKFDRAFALPVNLVSFSAQLLTNDVQLHWHTGNETGFTAFEAERSQDGRNFVPIGQRTALGMASDYSLTDVNPAAGPNGKLYYRLKTSGKGEQPVYSSVVAVTVGKKTVFGITASPNPFQRHLDLAVVMPKESEARLTIQDLTGRRIGTRVLLLAKGYSSVAVTETETLPSGVYTISLTYDGQQTTQRIIKE